MPFRFTFKPDPILQAIEGVDQLIDTEEHWGQGGWSGGSTTRLLGHGRRCPRTALYAHLGSAFSPLFPTTLAYFVRALPKADDALNGCVAFWNNRPERTFSELKAMIARARDLRLDELRAEARMKELVS